MRQRITYLLPLGTGIDPAQIVFNQTDLVFESTDLGAQERRVTISLNELAEEIQNALQDFHEIHLRVVSARNHHVFSPAVSRLSPGLHAFMTPRNSSSKTNFCSSVKRFIGEFKCESDEDAFIRPSITSERFASSSTFQYYQGPLDHRNVTSAINLYLCASLPQDHTASSLCHLASVASGADSATYVDVDFNAISQAVTITVVWSSLHPRTSPTAERYQVSRDVADGRLEVGVLQEEVARESEELSLGGYLTIIGEDDHASQTLFSFPSRHHPLSASDKTSFTAAFQRPTGLHPKFELTFPRASLQPPNPTCSLHAYWTIPSTLFIDRYQLSDPLFLASQHLKSLRSLSGEQDLEAPEWTIKGWGSAALLELALPPTDHPPATDWTVTVPTHLRYVDALGQAQTHADLAVPWPVVFWACRAEEGLKFPTNPFDRTNLGYDGLFGPKTMFYHIPPGVPVGGSLVESIKVPVISESGTGYVPVGTMAAVVLGFAWVCWQMFRGLSRSVTNDKKKQ